MVSFDKEFVIYNSFNQKAVFFDEETKLSLEEALKSNLDILAKTQPEFYDSLENEGFLVDSELDEVALLKAKVVSIDENEEVFLLTVNPTMSCNFKCNYCYESHVKGSKLGDAGVLKIKKLIAHQFANPKLKKISVAFFGGEPLLYFNDSVKPLLEEIANHSQSSKIEVSISFTTNGYLINRSFIEYLKQKNLKPYFQITLDGPETDHNQVRFPGPNLGSYQKIVKNIKDLALNGFSISVRINYNAKSLSNCVAITEAFTDLPKNILKTFLIFDFHRVWQDVKDDDLGLTLKRVVQEFHAKGLLVNRIHSPDTVENSCYADKRNSAVVNYNGDLYKCTARDFKAGSREGVLDDSGGLIWENGSLERRMNAKFKNQNCLSCRIMPLCNGGCSQVALENIGNNYCVYPGNADSRERQKDEVVVAKVRELIELENDLLQDENAASSTQESA